jgi:hypothetical protein
MSREYRLDVRTIFLNSWTDPFSLFMEEGAWVLKPLASKLFPLSQAICNLAKSTKPPLESINRKFTQNLRTPFHSNYFSLDRRHDVPQVPDPQKKK